MKKADVVTELGQLIDSSEKDFRGFCADKDVGYLSSLLNLMTATYNNVSDLKKELVQKYSPIDSVPEENREDVTKTLNGLYSKLMAIEQRVFILRELVQSKQLPPPFSIPQ